MKELPTFMLTMTRKNHALKTIVDSKSTFAFYQMQFRHQFQAILSFWLWEQFYYLRNYLRLYYFGDSKKGDCPVLKKNPFPYLLLIVISFLKSSLLIAVLIGIFSMWSKFLFWIAYAISFTCVLNITSSRNYFIMQYIYIHSICMVLYTWIPSLWTRIGMSYAKF